MALQYDTNQITSGLKALGGTLSSTGNRTTQPMLQQPVMTPMSRPMPDPRQQIAGDAQIAADPGARTAMPAPLPPGQGAVMPVLGGGFTTERNLVPNPPKQPEIAVETDQRSAGQQVTQPVQSDPNSLTPGVNAVALENLRGLIERYLAQPSAFNMPEIQAARDAFRTQQANESLQARQGIEADAVSRGLTFSTVPVSRFGDLAVKQAEQQRLFDTELNTRAALQHRDDLGRAISAALNFGQLAQQGELGRGQLALGAGQLGLQGAPDINEILRSLAMLAQGA